MPFWCLRAILHSHHFTRKYGERITGSRLTPDLLSMAVQNNIGVTIIDPIVRGETIGDHLKRTSQKTMQHHIEQRYP